MKNNVIYILILAILAVTALYLIRKPAGNTAELDRDMFKVDTLKIVSMTYEKDGRKIILNKGVGNWFVEGSKNFPADISTVNTLLKFASEITIKNIISDKFGKHSKFGVDSSAAVLTFRLQDNSFKSFLIGIDDRERRHSFYRKTDGDQVFLGTLFPRYRITPDETQWRDKIISSENRDTISKISLLKGKNSLEMIRSGNEWNSTFNGETKDTDPEKIKKLVEKISLFKAQGFIDDLDFEAQDKIITVIFDSGTGAKEIILSEYEGGFSAYIRDKTQGYRISKTDYDTFSDLMQ